MTVTATFNFTGQTALVTGATSGIGLAIASKLTTAGAHVIVGSDSEAATLETLEVLMSHGGRASAAVFDLSRGDEVRALASHVRDIAPRLDMLFLNAGITGAGTRAGEAGYEEAVERTFAVNVHHPRILCDELLPHMAKRGEGSVVLTSSLAGLRGNGNIGAYSLTKAAVAQLARDMAVRYGPSGLRVNALSPGLIATGWERNILANPEAADRRMQMTPLRRIGRPEEIADVALFLASDLASFVTGHNLVADGGTLITDGS
jgi:NAD(P)-dependent dehydrogenase (short-subunit alcohol dehydrogenase family)